MNHRELQKETLSRCLPNLPGCPVCCLRCVQAGNRRRHLRLCLGQAPRHQPKLLRQDLKTVMKPVQVVFQSVLPSGKNKSSIVVFNNFDILYACLSVGNRFPVSISQIDCLDSPIRLPNSSCVISLSKNLYLRISVWLLVRIVFSFRWNFTSLVLL